MTSEQLLSWVKKMGGMTQAAAYLDVTPVTIWRWSKNPLKIKRNHLRAIETQIGKISR